jgi:hypothetical protein
MLHLLRQLILMLICILFIGDFAQAGPPGRKQDTKSDQEKVAAVMKKAGEEAKNMTLPVNTFTKEGLQAAKQSADFFHSPEFQQKLQCEQQRLEREVFGQYITPWKRKRQTMADRQSRQFEDQDSERIFLFISSSVPDETIHAYIAAIARMSEPAVVLVMRGVVGGLKSSEGVKYFSRILKKDLSCRDGDSMNPQRRCPRYQVSIEIAADLFGRYGITRVPAVVYAGQKSSFLIQGDAALAYLLERINREAKSTTLDQLIKKIRGHG